MVLMDTICADRHPILWNMTEFILKKISSHVKSILIYNVTENCTHMIFVYTLPDIKLFKTGPLSRKGHHHCTIFTNASWCIIKNMHWIDVCI